MSSPSTLRRCSVLRRGGDRSRANSVALETDSTNLVKALTSNTFDQAPGGIIFREARVLLSLHLFLVSVAQVPRGYNMCAHELAKSGLQRDLDQPVIWTDPLPSFITTLRVVPSIDEYRTSKLQ